MIAELTQTLVEATLATSIAAAIVLGVRRPLTTRLGASVAYSAWLLVPVALLAVLLPAPTGVAMQVMALSGTTLPTDFAPNSPQGPVLTPQHVLLAVWLLGACVVLAMLWRQQAVFRRGLRGAHRRADGLHQASATVGLPAVIGLLRPHIVVPADFDARYDDTERELILCHERIHIRRFDLPANAAAALLRAVFWFNPLAHIAAARFRRDQELACDERVIARHPHQRRSYANAMLKTHIAGSPLPIGCHWQDATPLKERIAMLKLHAPGPKRTLLGAVLLAALCLSGGYATWAAQPAREGGEGEPGGSRFLVMITLEVDGESRRFEVHEDAGTPFTLAMEKDGHRYQGTFTVRDIDARQAYFEADLLLDGEHISSPRLVVAMGQRASMESGNPGGPLQKVSVVVTRMPSNQQATLSIEPGSRQIPYPPLAIEQNLGGRVVVQVDVGEDGNVRNATVVESEPAGVFDAVAIQAAEDMKFNPQIENGRPMSRRIRLPFRFDPKVGE